MNGLRVDPTVKISKLQDVQKRLTTLKEFLGVNKNFIDGLAGPEVMGRAATRQQEQALRAEHQFLHALTTLLSSIIEGISFVQMLFSERMEEIALAVNPEIRQRLKELTFEGLFATDGGREIAKELVKAVVNRNIENGAADVVVFKAQEQLKRAAERGSNTEFGRNLLNESLRLFKQVADGLSLEQLQTAVQQYISMQFYAGSIELALAVANEFDRGNRALLWIQNGRPEQVRA